MLDNSIGDFTPILYSVNNMNENIKSTLEFRQSVLDNVDDIYKHYNKKDVNQLSLFGSNDDNFKIDLRVKNGTDYVDLLNKEKEVLGLTISYNKLNRYELIRSRLCNTNIRNVFEQDRTNKNLVFLADLVNIRHMTAIKSGNKYYKLYFEDETGSYEFYLFGEYTKYIRDLFKNSVYLIKATYNKDRDSAFVTKIEKAETFSIEKYIKSIHIVINNKEDIFKLRKFVYKYMVGRDYPLYFNYLNETIKAPYRVNIDNDIVEQLISNNFNVIAKKNII